MSNNGAASDTVGYYLTVNCRLCLFTVYLIGRASLAADKCPKCGSETRWRVLAHAIELNQERESHE